MRRIRLGRPSPYQLQSLQAAIEGETFNYTPGILESQTPAAMVRDILEVEIGVGDEAWKLAKDAIRRWVHFDLGWVAIETGGDAPRPGLAVVVHAALAAIHITAACRVVSVHDLRDSAGTRFGFVYGSLQSHVEAGEELFEVRRDPSGRVTYRIEVIARPARWYTWAMKPFVDHQRRRFRSDSAAAMRTFVSP